MTLHVNQLLTAEQDLDYTRRTVDSAYQEIVNRLGFRNFTWKHRLYWFYNRSEFLHQQCCPQKMPRPFLSVSSIFYQYSNSKLKHLPTRVWDHEVTPLNVHNKPAHYSTADSNFYQDIAVFQFVLKKGFQLALGETRIPVYAVKTGILVYLSVICHITNWNPVGSQIVLVHTGILINTRINRRKDSSSPQEKLEFQFTLRNIQFKLEFQFILV